ncbi:polysaccharide biosynthesis protein [Piscinibacter sakaiensis]|uniref:polysaccharide biosynthesis protein n=1 Tax=Piscinibacter sakaiensis TaxID=1547922 RepID=UPI003AAC3EAA
MTTSGLADSILDLPRPVKRALAIAADIVLCGFAVWIALYLRLERWLPVGEIPMWAVFGSIALALPIFTYFNLYASIFRSAGWKATQAVARACMVYAVLYASIFTIIGISGVPRTVGIIQPLLMFMAVSGSRLVVRLLLGDLYRSIVNRQKLPGVLIYGAGSAGQQLASALAQSGEYRLVGYIDDDHRMQGRALDTVPIFAPSTLPGIIERLHVTDVLLAMPSIERQRRIEILESLRQYPVYVRTLPGVAELASGEVDLGDVHELDIADLLGRDAVTPDQALMEANIRGKVVLVTGAGGSIGSELCRQIVKCNPRRLLLLDLSEYALYQITTELQAIVVDREDSLAVELRPLLGSVTDERRLREIMSTWRPHTVYHAAAYKHVPMVEHNMLEGIRNNVWGTMVCARQAIAHGTQNFVLISTDKAVRPTNVMGASKRLSEMVLQALADDVATAARNSEGNREGSVSPTRFTMVRFGNVLGSSGSVVPLFRQQIAQGGPITLTHAEMTRYFMTIPEASQLVIQAGAMASGGDVFVLDMGEPVRIYDLARRMVELSGLRVADETNRNGDIEIKVTGLRPGEKLYEELLIGDGASPTSHPRIMKAHEDFLPWGELQKFLAELDDMMLKADLQGVRTMLQRLVSGYTPGNELVDWVRLAENRQDVELQLGDLKGEAVSEPVQAPVEMDGVARDASQPPRPGRPKLVAVATGEQKRA